MTRIRQHPILGEIPEGKKVKIMVDGQSYDAYEGEMIAAALLANGLKVFRYTKKLHEARGIFCGVGKCTDCIMTVDGVPNIRTCITPVQEGMEIETQYGLGIWKEGNGGEK